MFFSFVLVHSHNFLVGHGPKCAQVPIGPRAQLALTCGAVSVRFDGVWGMQQMSWARHDPGDFIQYLALLDLDRVGILQNLEEHL